MVGRNWKVEKAVHVRLTDMAQGIGADQFIVVYTPHVRGAQGCLPTKTFVWVKAAGVAARACLHKLRPSELIRRVQYHINLYGLKDPGDICVS